MVIFNVSPLAFFALPSNVAFNKSLAVSIFEITMLPFSRLYEFNAGSHRFVSYNNIPGGNYTFKVKLSDDKKISNATTIAVPLFIRTPFYRTRRFYL
ncbi:MAG: hypothetical protein ABI863_10355 [Ginsengibacter sp.]